MSRTGRRHSLVTTLLFAAAWAAPSRSHARAQEAPGATLSGPLAVAVATVSKPPTIDGKLDEAEWSLAAPVPDFRQWAPDRGEPANFPTEAHVLADARFLYVGARLTHDAAKGPLVALVHRRDVFEQTDLFRVWFDPKGDGRQAVVFGVNAANVQQDAWMSDVGEFAEDWSWSAVWQSATTRDDAGWAVEMKIPRSVLPRGSSPEAAAAWRIYFDRFVPGANEVAGSVVAPRETPFLSSFASLEGLNPAAGGPRIEILPYLLDRQSLEHSDASDLRGGERRVGIDLRLGFGDRALVDLALLPDAGLIESDPAVLNLSTVETLLPEKRSFFLEGADLFRVPGVQLFHSRRIGAGLEAFETGVGETLLEQPSTSELLGAVKLRGAAFADGRFAFLATRTDDAFATVRDARGNERRTLVEPGAWAAIGRLTQPLHLPARLGAGGSSIGLFVSRLEPVLSTGSFGNEATVAALDTVLKLGDGRTRASGVAAWSATREPEDAEVGAGYGEDRGHLAHLTVRQSFGGDYFARLETRDASRDFEANDLGYLPRADERRALLDVWHSRDLPSGPIGTFETRASIAQAQDQAGHVFDRRASTGGWASFRSGWSMNGDLGYAFDSEDDRELRTYDDPRKQYLAVPGYPYVNANFESPTSTPLFTVGRLLYEGRANGGTYEAAVDPRLRLGTRWMLRSGLRYRRELGGMHWIDSVGAPALGGEVPLAGDRSLREREVSLRLGFAPSPRLSFEAYSQWLAAEWAFAAPGYFVGDQFVPGLPAGVETPDLGEAARSWILNAQTRWEFRPGSTVLVAYQQANQDEATIRRALDPRSFAELPSERSLQVKLTWFWGR